MSGWPALRVEDWTETRDALHLFTQVVGKVKLKKTPLINHWWNVTLLVSSRGLTSGAVPAGTGLFQMDFDFIDSRLKITSADGRGSEVALRPMSVADFYAEVLQALADLDIRVEIHAVPNELPVAVAFDQDRRVREYRPEHTRAFWLQLVQAHRVLSQFRAGFVGKASPVHFFWGSFDLAVTRFSGRRATTHPGGAPNCPAWVMVEGYSHEVSSCGFWPGGGEEGAFYSYAYPEPDGFAEQRVRPSQAFYSAEFRQFLLPYEVVRAADDPDEMLLSFLEDTYGAAATLAEWDPSLAIAPQAPASTPTARG
ncbi:MAG: hypothetical protein JO304_27740 [Solirubrobacterales bacterium]|nr:hypothetical protein [Solirubrobacterales bacterium]